MGRYSEVTKRVGVVGVALVALGGFAVSAYLMGVESVKRADRRHTDPQDWTRDVKVHASPEFIDRPVTLPAIGRAGYTLRPYFVRVGDNTTTLADPPADEARRFVLILDGGRVVVACALVDY